VLHHRFADYTNCFRVYRRGAVSRLQVRQGGFLGVAEMLGRPDQQVEPDQQDRAGCSDQT
jgi:hypothetical protein